MSAKKKKAASAEAAPVRRVPAVIATHAQQVHDDMKAVLDHPLFSDIRNTDPLTISQG